MEVENMNTDTHAIEGAISIAMMLIIGTIMCMGGVIISGANPNAEDAYNDRNETFDPAL
jgi:hypothetical protein